MKRLVLLIAFLNTLALHGQDMKKYDPTSIDSNTHAALDSILLEISSTDRYCVNSGTHTHWVNYERLEESADQKELVELCSHPNPVIRVSCFRMLFMIDSHEIVGVMKSRQKDDASVLVAYGCRGIRPNVISYMVNLTKPKAMKDYGLTKAETKELASVRRQVKKSGLYNLNRYRGI